MKTEINLRTREFVQARHFYWPRVIYTVLVILVIGAVGAGGVYVYLYKLSLENEVALLSARKAKLTIRVAPLEEKEAEIRALQARSAIREEMLTQITPWSRYLAEMESAAVDGGLAVQLLAITSEGKATLNGHSPTMKDVALYTQVLREMTFITQADYAGMRLDSGGGYSFVIEAVLVTGGGLD